MRAVLIVALLAGCATADLPKAPGEVLVPAPGPCLKRADVPPKPDFVTDAQILAVPKERVVFVLGSDRLARQEYEGKLEAKLAGCVGEQPIPSQTAVPASTPETKLRWQFWK